MKDPGPYARMSETLGQDLIAEELQFRAGAAVAFGLMGMAEAIRNRSCSECNGRGYTLPTRGRTKPERPCTCSVRHGHFSNCQTNA